MCLSDCVFDRIACMCVSDCVCLLVHLVIVIAV